MLEGQPLELHQPCKLVRCLELLLGVVDDFHQTPVEVAAEHQLQQYFAHLLSTQEESGLALFVVLGVGVVLNLEEHLVAEAVSKYHYHAMMVAVVEGVRSVAGAVVPRVATCVLHCCSNLGAHASVALMLVPQVLQCPKNYVALHGLGAVMQVEVDVPPEQQLVDWNDQSLHVVVPGAGGAATAEVELHHGRHAVYSVHSTVVQVAVSLLLISGERHYAASGQKEVAGPQRH